MRHGMAAHMTFYKMNGKKSVLFTQLQRMLHGREEKINPGKFTSNGIHFWVVMK